MKWNNDLKALLVLFIILILLIPSYLLHPSNSYYFPVLFILLTGITGIIFEQMNYYNKKNVYRLIIALYLLIMWAASFMQPFSSGADKLVYYIETGLLSILIIFILIYVPKEWKKKEKELEPQ